MLTNADIQGMAIVGLVLCPGSPARKRHRDRHKNSYETVTQHNSKYAKIYCIILIYGIKSYNITPYRLVWGNPGVL
jgi:hypothetical protein